LDPRVEEADKGPELASPPPALAPRLPGILSRLGALTTRVLPALAPVLSGVLLALASLLACLRPRKILFTRNRFFTLSKPELHAHREGEHGHE